MGVSGINNSDKCEKEYILKITKDVYENMIAYCQMAIPYEACGLLSGHGSTAKTLWKLKNESQSLNRFHMSVEAIKHSVQLMGKMGEDLVGIFHSHPSSKAIPSSHDIENNPYKDLAYLIVSLQKGNKDVGCFKMDGRTVSSMKIIIIDV